MGVTRVTLWHLHYMSNSHHDSVMSNAHQKNVVVQTDATDEEQRAEDTQISSKLGSKEPYHQVLDEFCYKVFYFYCHNEFCIIINNGVQCKFKTEIFLFLFQSWVLRAANCISEYSTLTENMIIWLHYLFDFSFK